MEPAMARKSRYNMPELIWRCPHCGYEHSAVTCFASMLLLSAARSAGKRFLRAAEKRKAKPRRMCQQR